MWVIPQLGAKVVSVFDRVADHEWIDGGRSAELWASPVGSAFDKSPLRGWDECFPTVAGGEWQGVEQADHGDLWARPWEVVPTDHFADPAMQLTTRIDHDDWRMTRTLRVEGARLRADYVLQNFADHARSYVWAQHPLLSCASGDRLEIPAGTVVQRVELASGSARRLGGGPLSWPGEVEGLALPELELGPTPGYVKLSLAWDDTAGPAVLRCGRSGATLAGRFGPVERLPWLGVWLTRGGFAGLHQIALEPTNAASDALALAGDHRSEATTLQAGGTRSWWVRWDLGR